MKYRLIDTLFNKDSAAVKGVKAALIMVVILAVLLCTGCGTKEKAAEAIDEKADSILEEHRTGSMELKYANQFHVDYYEDGIAVVTIEDGLQYLVIEGSDELPEWLPDEEVGEMTIICAPAQSVYVAASSAMDLIDAAGALDSVKMTSTQAKDWGIDKIRKLVEDGTIQYIGKYRAPDYEALLEGDIDLDLSEISYVASRYDY